MTLPSKKLAWPIIYAGVEEIAKSEGCKLVAYQDIVGVWTCGWGETEGVTKDTVWTQAEADQRFCDSLTVFTVAVRSYCTVEPNANELAAMVSLAYNIGLGAFKKSTVLRAHNKSDHAAAARAFNLFCKAGGQPVKGLILRRAREAALYLTPVATDERLPIAQAVDTEKPMAKSWTLNSGAATLVSGALATLSSVSGQVKEFAENLGVQPLTIFGIVALVGGAVVMYQRIKQRREGRA